MNITKTLEACVLFHDFNYRHAVALSRRWNIYVFRKQPTNADKYTAMYTNEQCEQITLYIFCISMDIVFFFPTANFTLLLTADSFLLGKSHQQY